MECYYVFLNFFLFAFDFCLSIWCPEVSANCNFLFEACTILIFATVHFKVLFSFALHLILKSLRYIYIFFSVNIFLCFRYFGAIFSCVLQMLLGCWLCHNFTFIESRINTGTTLILNKYQLNKQLLTSKTEYSVEIYWTQCGYISPLKEIYWSWKRYFQGQLSMKSHICCPYKI